MDSIKFPVLSPLRGHHKLTEL